jgi:hypothetical protein
MDYEVKVVDSPTSDTKYFRKAVAAWSDETLLHVFGVWDRESLPFLCAEEELQSRGWLK